MYFDSTLIVPSAPVSIGTTIAVEMNQGTGNPKRMSKMLLPMEEETAISPSPIRAITTLLTASGILVPIARKVRPMIISSMPMTAPKIVAHHTSKKLKMAIQTKETENVTRK
mmetsp:Transcript_17790/g.23047  ORF Transcript_17790/g.23047 Transcript_17790/m.23047 type:complete len:112 (+) Transcript_17790:300-635(+)